MNDNHDMPVVRKPPEGEGFGSIEALLTTLMPVAASLPLAPVQHAATFILGCILRRHADMLARLRELGNAAFLIDVTNLPILFILTPGAVKPSIEILRRDDNPPAASATIRGSLPALLLLLQGRADGDALFFSRALTIEGDMAAVLCLRNALDGAEIDLIGDIAARFGPAADLARRAIQFHGWMGLRAGRALSQLQAARFARTPDRSRASHG
jgi:predicted lipid carrier protein YhbT